jgi:hypothetical protein
MYTPEGLLRNDSQEITVGVLFMMQGLAEAQEPVAPWIHKKY